MVVPDQHMPPHVQWVADTLVGTPGAGADTELARADFQITVAEHLAAARFPPCPAGMDAPLLSKTVVS